MDFFAPPVERLIEEFAKLPGIGQKTAQRLAFYVLDLPKEDAERFADAIRDALGEAGIIIEDTPQGSTWSLK